MKRWILGLLLSVLATFWAQAQNQEVVMTATTGSKVAVAMPAPKSTGLDEALVNKEFREVLLRDLEEAGPFAVLKNNLPSSADPSTYHAWVTAGTDWLLDCRLNKSTAGELEIVLQVLDVKSTKAVFNKKYSGKEAALRRMAHTIADDLVARLTGERGVATSRIVFVRQLAPGVKDIFQLDRDGANLV
jgi:TolB protein